jgi:hypothetical protein
MVGAIGLATSTNPAPSRSRRLLAALPVVPWILVFLVLTFLGARWPNLDFLQTPSFELLRDLDPEIPRNLLISACIALSAGVFFLVSLFVRPTVHRVFATGLITQLIWICVLALGILPVAADLLPKAKMRLGAWANENFSNSDCLHILGPRSAAVNLTYRRANISHCKPGDQEWALAPLLSQEKCLSQGMTIEKRDQLMILCKHPKRNPESPL